MPFALRFSADAKATLQGLADGGAATSVKLEKVRKALSLLQADPTHPGLHSHLYQQFPGVEKGKIWDSYVENRTPGAWRIYWKYGPDEIRVDTEGADEPVSVIIVLVLGPHL